MKKLFGIAILTLAILVISQTSYAVAPLISGSTPFSVLGSWSATVFWEVWSPGDDDLRIAVDSDYHYWYYILNSNGSSVDLTSFTVGNPIGATINLWGSVDKAGSTPAPIAIFPNPTSIAYQFATVEAGGFGLIGPGISSDWLYYSSPVEPGPVPGGLIDGGTTDWKPVPGPAPEPGSMILLGLGLLGFGGRAFRKRFKA